MKKNLIGKISTLVLAFTLIFNSSYAQVNLTLTGGTYPTGNAMMGIAYGNGVYVSIGYNGYIVKSTDGVNWTIAKNSSWLVATYNKICYGGGLFVGVSSSGQIITSPDGTNWTQQTSPTSNPLSDVQYLGGKYYILGSNNTALVSTDAVTWTSFSIGAAGTDYLSNIFYAAGKYYIGVRVAGTGDSRCYSSTTGLSGSWSSVLITASGSLNKIVYMNNRFFAFNSTPSVYSSTDGVSWSVAGGARLAAPNQIFTGFYDGLTYFLFGTSSEFSYCSVFTSLDGINFTLQPQATTLTVQHAAFLNGRYFLVGNEGMVGATTGLNWSFVSSSFNSVATDGTSYVAVGQNSTNEAAIQLSTDYINWTPVVPGIIRALNGVTYGGGKFVAVGNNNALGFSTYAVSTDGLVWVTGSTLIADNLRAVCYGNSKYVAVGLSGRIIYSANGINWTSAENGGTQHYYGVSYVNGYFVAVGGSPTNGGFAKVKYSVNGTTWTDVSPAGLVGHFHGITYGAGKYMLVGRDNTVGSLKFFSMTSTDITSAASFSTAAVISTPEGELGTLGYGAVSYNNATFTAVANLRLTPFNAYVLTSANATSWTATPVNSTTRLRAVIAVGSSFRSAGATPGAFLRISIGATLPLKLLSFAGHVNNQLALLDWKTNEEANTDRFEIEASDDGQRFYTAGSLAAKNTAGINSYNFTDAEKLNGTRYYRLKMIDRDGKFTYSQLIRLEARANVKTINIYPNPATETITLTLLSIQSSSLAIYTNKGEKVFTRELQGNRPAVNIGSLAPGMYVLQVKQAGVTYTEKLVKK